MSEYHFRGRRVRTASGIRVTNIVVYADSIEEATTTYEAAYPEFQVPGSERLVVEAKKNV